VNQCLIVDTNVLADRLISRILRQGGSWAEKIKTCTIIIPRVVLFEAKYLADIGIKRGNYALEEIMNIRQFGIEIEIEGEFILADMPDYVRDEIILKCVEKRDGILMTSDRLLIKEAKYCILDHTFSKLELH